MPKEEMHTEKKESTITAACGEMDRFEQEIKLKKDLEEKLEKDVIKLTTIKGAISEKLTDYCKARGELEKKKNEFNKYHKLKAPLIYIVVKEKKATLDRIINNYDKDINNIKGEITKLENERIPATKMEFCTADKEYQKTKYEFDKQEEKIKNYKTCCEDKLDKLEKLKKEIEELDETERGPQIYVRLNELKRILDEVELKKGDDLEKDFYDSFKKYDNSDKERQGKKEKQKITIDELKEKKENLKRLKNNRKDDILNQIDMETWEKS